MPLIVPSIPPRTDRRRYGSTTLPAAAGVGYRCPMRFDADLDRFYDPDVGPGSGLHIVLRHSEDEAVEAWFMERRIAYCSREFDTPIEVPRDRATFETDLTSVPAVFSWLVPRTGSHLAAALVHDALTPPFSVPDVPDWVGPQPVTQMQADRVLRHAMGDLGTPPIRRWLVWSAVSVPTAWKVSRLRGLLAYLSIFAIVVLGWFATLDLFDQGKWLPWMGDQPWNRELIFGGIAALVIPLVLSLLWPKGLRPAGIIVGVSVAALLHLTAAIAGVTFGYQVLEYRHRAWGPPKVALKLLTTAAALAAVVLTFWMCRRY